MKSDRKLIAILVSICMIATMFPAVVWAEETAYDYEIDLSKGLLTVKGDDNGNTVYEQVGGGHKLYSQLI